MRSVVVVCRGRCRVGSAVRRPAVRPSSVSWPLPWPPNSLVERTSLPPSFDPSRALPLAPACPPSRGIRFCRISPECGRSRVGGVARGGRVAGDRSGSLTMMGRSGNLTSETRGNSDGGAGAILVVGSRRERIEVVKEKNGPRRWTKLASARETSILPKTAHFERVGSPARAFGSTRLRFAWRGTRTSTRAHSNSTLSGLSRTATLPKTTGRLE